MLTFMRSKLKVIMYTTLKLITTHGKNDHLLIFTKGKTSFDEQLFSDSENKYLGERLNKDVKQVCINQLHRFVFIQSSEVTKKKEKYYALEEYRKAGAKWAAKANLEGIKKITLIDNGDSDAVMALAEGMALANYQFLKYKSTAKKETHSLEEITISSKKISKSAFHRLTIVVEATCKARDLVNEPQSFLNATVFAAELNALCKKAGIKCQVFDKRKIKELKMGGLLAVNLGSPQPPTFTVMEWKPKHAVNKKPYVLIGKGVVYDTGGMSLKPTTNSMDYMKCDMAGGAVVGTSIYAIAKAKLPIHVVALVPATDNRPDGEAYVPGDVITMMSGKTVEVLNTDAEGRLILADALHYAKRYDPSLVFDFATLTGAAAAAIGHYGIVAMGTAGENEMAKLNDSGNNVYERLAVMPFWDEYDELLKSDIADIKNIGGPAAGAITAGRFLNYFVDAPYVHFDIAGPAFNKTTDSYRSKNGTGVGVRLLFDFFCKKATVK